MHIADALISPAVGGTCWAASVGLALWSGRILRTQFDERRVPLMGVFSAFIFAAQMINFVIPGTGSSGHLGGGLLLAILLGPQAAFLVMASVLIVQALLFADGGLLALGCNMLNLGFFTCFVAYPLVYRRLVTPRADTSRQSLAAVIAAVTGLQLGALAVVLETTLSGISELPFGPFLLLMQPIHLAIGIVEGLVTAAVIGAVHRTRPDVLAVTTCLAPAQIPFLRRLVIGLTAIVIIGSLLFASTKPDGLEWSMRKISGKEELRVSGPVHELLADIQSKLAFLSDYNPLDRLDSSNSTSRQNTEKSDSWLAVNAGILLAALIGGSLTVALTSALCWFLRARRAEIAAAADRR